jgi:hypothetical protein
LPFFELAGIVLSKLLAPLANRFVGYGDASFGQEFFDLTEAETESMIEPNRMADNFRRKAMTLVAGLFGFHEAQSATSELLISALNSA